ncbi:hypothetical protein V2G26_014854 [Clonostachys chloroleuca]
MPVSPPKGSFLTLGGCKIFGVLISLERHLDLPRFQISSPDFQLNLDHRPGTWGNSPGWLGAVWMMSWDLFRLLTCRFSWEDRFSDQAGIDLRSGLVSWDL